MLHCSGVFSGVGDDGTREKQCSEIKYGVLCLRFASSLEAGAMRLR